MDKIEMIIQKYGDKIQVGYQTLRNQYVISNIFFIFTLISIFGFLASVLLLTFINIDNDSFNKDYFDKEWYAYADYKIKRILVYLNIILPIIFLLIIIICIILNATLAPDYGFIKSLIGDK